MPVNSIGSATEGAISTSLDLQSIQMNQFKLAEAPIKLEEERIDLIKDRISLAQDIKMLSLMQGLRMPQGTANTVDGMAGMLDQMALIQLESGKVDAAEKTASSAARLRDTVSKVDYRTYRIQNDRLSKFANVLSQVPDTPDGFREAITAIQSADPTAMRDPKFQQIANMQWRPGLVKSLERSVLTAKEQAEVNYRSAAEKHANAAAVADEHRVKLIDSQERKNEEWLKEHGKNAGSNAPPYKAEELRTITDMATVDYPGADPADIRVRSRNVVLEAKKMVKTDSLSFPEAARRAYEQSRTQGVFSGLRQMPTAKGSKPGAPLALPAAKDAKDLEKRLQQNQWYTVNGVPQLWMGDKFYSEDELSKMDQEDRDELGVSSGDPDGDIFPEERTTPEDDEPAIEH